MSRIISAALGGACEHPLLLARRRDIVAEPIMLRGQRKWHLKDPLALRYWQFGDEELFLWRQLDGSLSLSTWQHRFHQEFAPRRIELSQLQGFLGLLHREGLIVSNDAGQADTLLKRTSEHRRNQWLGRLANPLAIRFRGIDPDQLLTWLYATCRWVFHRLWITLSCLLILSAVLLVAVEWSHLVARWSQADIQLTPDRVLGLAIALAFAKVLHELGHALTCKHYGGECHEMGVMLLVLTPCLYCNVSDVWLVPDKWRRMAVSGAGIWVELWLAAAATWLWWWTAPGLINSLCLNLMVVCSISTVLFNGNPLLRYDGYYLLSDWLEMPNLSVDAAARLRSFVGRLLFGGEATDNSSSPRQAAFLLAYGAASFAYRAFVLVLVLWFLHRQFFEHQLQILGHALIGLVLLGMTIPIVKQASSSVSVPRRRRIQPWRLLATSCGASVVASVVLFVPWPSSILAPATIRPDGAEAIYVTVPGRLRSGIQAGTVVRQGETIATLSNDDIASDLTRLNGERAVLERHAQILRRQQVGDSRAGVASSSGQRTIVEQSLRDVERQLAQRQVEHDNLVVRAPCDGVVISTPARPNTAEGLELAGWSGLPLDVSNRDCYLDSGVLLAYVGIPERCEALVLVDQSDVALLRVGQAVKLQLDELPGRFLNGRVTTVAAATTRDVPPELIAKRRIAVEEGGTGGLRSVHGLHAVRVELPEDIHVPYGASGQARIRVSSRTLGQRAYEAFCRTFRFAS